MQSSRISKKAILYGFLVGSLSIVVIGIMGAVVGTVMALKGRSAEEVEAFLASPLMLPMIFVISSVITILAGFTVVRMVGHDKMRHALYLGLIF
jgi:hypothetical protein